MEITGKRGKCRRNRKSENLNTSNYVTNLWMRSSCWGFLEGYLSIDTFAKVSILYWYLFSLILPITNNVHHSTQCPYPVTLSRWCRPFRYGPLFWPILVCFDVILKTFHIKKLRKIGIILEQIVELVQQFWSNVKHFWTKVNVNYLKIVQKLWKKCYKKLQQILKKLEKKFVLMLKNYFLPKPLDTRNSYRFYAIDSKELIFYSFPKLLKKVFKRFLSHPLLKWFVQGLPSCFESKIFIKFFRKISYLRRKHPINKLD